MPHSVNSKGCKHSELFLSYMDVYQSETIPLSRRQSCPNVGDAIDNDYRNSEFWQYEDLDLDPT